MYQWTKDAKLAWNLLNGVFLIYKPPGIHFLNVRKTIIQNLCRDLNEMEVRPPMKHVCIEGPTTQEMRITVRDSFADNLLVVGPRYQIGDFKLATANLMSQESSGVLVCGINYGVNKIHKLKEAKLTKFYRIKGVLGQARENDFTTGRIVEKSTWKHIKRHHIDQICAGIQSSHQRKMFELCGLDIQSQAAYELAVKGPIRPAVSKVPMIYTVKCINFEPPKFTLEIVCINENDTHLKALISEIGFRLKSTAYCNYIQCAQLGLFNVTDALLSKNWDLQCVVDSISHCEKVLKEHPYMLDQEHIHLVSQEAKQEYEL